MQEPRAAAHDDAFASAAESALDAWPLDQGQVVRTIGGINNLSYAIRARDGDYILIENGRVSGVLDFEFAGRDLRAVDLARSLSMFGGPPWADSKELELLLAFAAGYREEMQLTGPEIEALPDLMLLYRVLSLLAREARRRRGIASDTDVEWRARELLQMETWLELHSNGLLRAIR